MAHHGVSAQGLNVELTQLFFDGVIDNLQHLAESNLQTSQQLADQQQRQQEAPQQQLAQESVGVYMNFINSMFAFCQQGMGTPSGRPEGGRPPSEQSPTSYRKAGS